MRNGYDIFLCVYSNLFIDVKYERQKGPIKPSSSVFSKFFLRCCREKKNFDVSFKMYKRRAPLAKLGFIRLLEKAYQEMCGLCH